MDFWGLSDGESAVTNAATYEAPSNNNFDPLPEGSLVLAMLDSVKWKTDEDGSNERISARWSIVEPVEYKNRKVSQPLWVTDDNPNKTGAKIAQKRDKDKRMLAAIDANCGGKLAKTPRKPTDDDLALALTNKPVMIELRVMDSNTGPFNWVSNVYSKTAKAVNIPAVSAATAPKPAAKPATKATSFADDLDDDVPF